jgi:hypothetical protein
MIGGIELPPIISVIFLSTEEIYTKILKLQKVTKKITLIIGGNQIPHISEITRKFSTVWMVELCVPILGVASSILVCFFRGVTTSLNYEALMFVFF